MVSCIMMKGTKDPWPLTCGPLGQAQSIRSYLMAHGPGTAHGHMVHGPVKLCLGHGPRTTFTIHPFCYVYIYIYAREGRAREGCHCNIQPVYDLQVMQPPAMTSRWTPVQTPTPTIPTGVKTTPHGSPTNGIGADAGVQIARLVCSRKKKWHACT